MQTSKLPITLLVTSVSTERLGNCGIIYYQTNLLGIYHHL